MYGITFGIGVIVLLSSAVAVPVQGPTYCKPEMRQAAVAKEIKTIGSHSLTDALAIPLAPLASRTFFITPNELRGNITLPPVNVGVTADTIRTELVGLATVLNAGVPPESVHYTPNKNGSMTVDFVQTDRIVLPRVNAREIHEFDQSSCQITRIVGYVHGSLICGKATGNAIVERICSLAAKAS